MVHPYAILDSHTHPYTLTVYASHFMTMAYQNLNQTLSEYPVVFGLPNQSFEIFVFVIGNFRTMRIHYTKEV